MVAAMDVKFLNDDLTRIEQVANFNGGYPPEAVRGFRKVMGLIRAAADERDLYRMRSLHFEKLKGDRSGQHSLRLNKQWRLIVEIISGEPKNTLAILAIEDYH